jgi:HAE1 family hydrophobic/amphiphilic exporter-1
MIVAELFKRASAVKKMQKYFLFARPTLVGFGFTNGFELQLQDQKEELFKN